MAALDFLFPNPDGALAAPAWEGDAFRIGAERRRVLAYEVGVSGWSDELTRLHEEGDGERHFINRASRLAALSAIARLAPVREPLILEIGCASGYFLRDLEAAFPAARIMGADYTLATLEAVGARLPGVPLLRFDVTRCPLPDASVDVVVALNVLEHIERDDLALAQIFRILRPGGLLVLEVPAGPGLYGSYDRLLMHHRRYALAALERLTRAAGFATLERSHLGFFLYPAFWLAKKRALLRDAAGGDVRAAVVRQIAASSRWNPLLHPLMEAEARLRRRLFLPFGIRCLLNCAKPPAA